MGKINVKTSAVLMHFAFFYALFSSPKVKGSNEISNEKINYRLPNTTKPIRYDLELDIYFSEDRRKEFKINGMVKILFEVKKVTNHVVLHSKNLIINSVELKNDFNETIPVHWALEPRTDFLKITCENEKLDPSLYNIEIHFKGNLTYSFETKGKGLSTDFYINKKGQTSWFAATHFEPQGARRTFPCFDEPGLKAIFKVQVTNHKNFTVISNTEVQSRTLANIDERVTTIFEPTPVMSTYILAILVSEFSNVTNHRKHESIYFRTVVNSSDASFALKLAERVLKKYAKYFDIPFEMNKLDLAEVPGYQGALENWGSVFFSEFTLLYNKSLSSREKMQVATTISHEDAHQWLGNLVTCKWWKYLWLNEGVSEFLSINVLMKLEPTWQSYLYYHQANSQNEAFHADEKFSTSRENHPIEKEVESPEDILFLLDDLSQIIYDKGSSVTRMMQHFVTEPNFQRGIRKYLKKYKHDVVESADLYEMMQDSINEEMYELPFTVKDIMDSWVTKPGYPVLHVTRDYLTKTVLIEQKHVYGLNAMASGGNNQTWYISINFSTEKHPDFNNTVPDIWLKDPSINISDKAEPADWLILNKQQTGHYRVNYDEQNWLLITNYLKTSDREKIHVTNRAQLMIDALKFHQHNLLSVEPILNLIGSLEFETEYAVQFFGNKLILWLHHKLINTHYHKQFKEAIGNLLTKIFNLVDFKENKNEDFTINMIRELILEWTCKVDIHNDYTKLVEAQFEAWLDKPSKNKIHPDLMYAIFYCGIRYKNITEETYNSVKEKIVNNEMEFDTFKIAYEAIHFREKVAHESDESELDWLIDNEIMLEKWLDENCS